MVLKGYCVRLQSSEEEAEKGEKSTGCHDDSPVLFDFDEDDEDEDSYGMLVSLPLSYDAWSEAKQGKEKSGVDRIVIQPLAS